MINSKIILILLSFFVFISCEKRNVFESYHNTNGIWHKDSTYSFSWHQQNKEVVNLYLMLRNNHDYEFNNIFVISKLKFPNNHLLIDTLEYAIANPDGSFIDKKVSQIIENKLFIKEKIVLDTGHYQLQLEHANRKNGVVEPISQLKGIESVGFRIDNNISKP